MLHTRAEELAVTMAVHPNQFSLSHFNFPCNEQDPIFIPATGYGLDGPGIESRWGARFSAPVQTGPEAHQASCKMGIGSFPGVKSGRGVTLTPHPLLVPWSRKNRAITLLPLWAVRPAQGCTLPLTFIFTFPEPVRSTTNHWPSERTRRLPK